MDAASVPLDGHTQDVTEILSKLGNKWKTELEAWHNEEKKAVGPTLHRDSYSNVGSCLSEAPICMLLQQEK